MDNWKRTMMLMAYNLGVSFVTTEKCTDQWYIGNWLEINTWPTLITHDLHMTWNVWAGRESCGMRSWRTRTRQPGGRISYVLGRRAECEAIWIFQTSQLSNVITNSLLQTTVICILQRQKAALLSIISRYEIIWYTQVLIAHDACTLMNSLNALSIRTNHNNKNSQGKNVLD